MKAGIHPDYQQVEVVCVCGNSFYVGSTQKSFVLKFVPPVTLFTAEMVHALWIQKVA